MDEVKPIKSLPVRLAKLAVVLFVIFAGALVRGVLWLVLGPAPVESAGVDSPRTEQKTWRRGSPAISGAGRGSLGKA